MCKVCVCGCVNETVEIMKGGGDLCGYGSETVTGCVISFEKDVMEVFY